MVRRTQALLELRISFDAVMIAREKAATCEGEDGLREVRHAERNFLATAEALARLVPALVPRSEAEQLFRQASEG